MYKTTLWDFAGTEIDTDVFLDYDGDFCMAFVGPVKFTAVGLVKFIGILDLPVNVHDEGPLPYAEVVVDGPGKMAAEVKRFLRCAAGYCSEASYKEYFEEE